MTGVGLVQERLEEVVRLCERFGVVRLRLFGSAITDEWNPRTSDLDFLVEYGPKYRELHPLESLVGLKLALEALFQRPVDVVNLATLRNPILRRNVMASAQNLYEVGNPGA
jgi:hypothetical protein